MTDRELLKLAAKAVGYKDVKPCYTTNKMQALMRQEVVCGGSGRRSFAWVREDWNPLTDDGDALRLAVKLRLPLSFPNKQTGKCTNENKYGIEAWVDCGSYWHSSDSMYYPHGERLAEDPYAATRRAIVRAAAEIGKAAL